MSTDYLTIKEASEKFGKAEITIRRLVRSVVNDKEHERTMVKPSVTEVAKLKKEKKPFTYSVNAILLEKVYGEVEKVKAARKAKEGTSDNEYFELIKKQLEVKDEQIRALNQSLDEMTARTRETNVLMKGLQENLLLTSSNGAFIESKQKKKKWWQL